MNSAGTGCAVAAPSEVDPCRGPPASLRVMPDRPVEVGDLPRRSVDERPEVLADELIRAEAGQPLDGVGQERQSRVGADRPDEVRRVLDEVPVALLRFGQAGQRASSW